MLVLVATWEHGLHAVAGGQTRRELDGHSVQALAADGQGGALAVVDGHALWQRGPDGAWRTLATSAHPLSCCLAAGGAIYAGTDDAHVLRLAGAELVDLPGFQDVAGRDTWYAGSAVIDGVRVGPPLGVRSLDATLDGALLVNVHVGGIPRSTDGGRTWQPTIAIDTDVHEVCAHPTRPELVAAAAGAGLGISTDGGATWRIETAGLQATYCSAVAFAGDDLLVAALEGHFSREGGLYTRPVTGGTLQAIGGPLAGIADTRCIATRGDTVAVADHDGHLRVRDGAGWTVRAVGLPGPAAVLIV